MVEPLLAFNTCEYWIPKVHLRVRHLLTCCSQHDSKTKTESALTTKRQRSALYFQDKTFKREVAQTADFENLLFKVTSKMTQTCKFPDYYDNLFLNSSHQDLILSYSGNK